MDADTVFVKNAGTFTLNPSTGDIDAVAEPLAILSILNANADCGISNNPAPLPLKTEPLFILILPLTNKLPLNVEPLIVDSTTNPNSFVTDAVTLPLVIKLDNNASGANAERGIPNKPTPLPLKNEPV